MSLPLVIFKAINSSLQQQELLQKLLADQIPVHLRMPNETELSLTPMSLNSSLQIKCQYQGNAFFEDIAVTLVLNFTLNNEKYMAEVQVTFRNSLLTLSVLNLFHLQRRKNFRYILPPNHPGFFRVKTLGSDNVNMSMGLVDISTEGCAVRIQGELPDLKLGTEMTGEIILEGQKSILVLALLQNIRATENETTTLGLKFIHTAQNREGDIVQALALLQRNLFMKRAA